MAGKIHEIAFRLAGKLSGSFTSSFNTVAGNLQKTNQNITKLQRELKGLEIAHKKGGLAADEYARKQAKVSQELEKQQKRQQALAHHIGAKNANSQQQAKYGGLAMRTAAVGAAMFAAPVAIAANFEQSMSKVKAMTSGSAEQMAALTNQARELGRDTVFTASEAAEGMRFLGMAGFKTEQIMQSMPGMLDLAAAGAIDLGTAADISSNILSGFGLKAEKMGRVSDAMAKTFTTSNTTMQGLGDTMKYVAPVANAVGLSLEQTAAMAGMLGNVGIQGSQAGTALRAAMLRLAAPPKMAEKALGELTNAVGGELAEMVADLTGTQQALSEFGVETVDGAGNLKPMVNILEELNMKMDGMGTGDRMEKIKKIFGAEAAAGMTEILKQAGKTVDEQGNKIVDSTGRQTTALRKYIDDIEKSDGVAKKIAVTMNDNAMGSWIRFKSALESVAISVGNVLLPGLRSAAEPLAVLASKISAFAESHPVLTKYVIGGTAALVGLTFAFAALGYVVAITKGGLLSLSGLVLKADGSIRGATIATKLWTGVQWLWNTAMSAGKWFLSPVRLVAYKAGVLAIRGATVAWTAALWLWSPAMRVGRGLLSVGRLILYYTTLGVAKVATIAWTAAQKLWNIAMVASRGLLSVGRLVVYYTTVGLIRVATRTWTAAQWLWNAAMAANPIGLVIAGVAGLIGIGYLLYKNWDTVKAFFARLWDSPAVKIALFLAGPVGWLIGATIGLIANWDKVKKWFTTLWNEPGKALQDFVDGIKEKFGPVITWLEEKKDSLKGLFGRGRVEQVEKLSTATQITPYARGGIITTPHMGLVGEAGDEAIIPLDGSTRAISLWQQAGQSLGMFPREAAPEIATVQASPRPEMLASIQHTRINNQAQTTHETTISKVLNMQNLLAAPANTPFQAVANTPRSGDNSFVFHAAPVNITVQGNAENNVVGQMRQEMQQVMQTAAKDFKQQFEAWKQQERRLSYG